MVKAAIGRDVSYSFCFFPVKFRGQTENQLEGKMPRGRALRCRVRYFTDGAVLDSAVFVDQMFETQSESFWCQTQQWSPQDARR